MVYVKQNVIKHRCKGMKKTKIIYPVLPPAISQQCYHCGEELTPGVICPPSPRPNIGDLMEPNITRR